jgi:GT2 family glycosyltransferase
MNANHQRHKVNTPPVTVVISTRNRGDSVVQTVRTILLNNYPCLEMSIVDQSEDDRTEISLRGFLDSPRISYVRTTTIGLSAGLNLGIRNAQTELIAITGDDCEVQENWLAELAAALAADRRIGIVFGNVLPGPHDSRTEFVPAYLRDEPFLACSMREKHRIGGTSACMMLRRSMWEAIGGFDPMLGVGAPFRAGEEADLALRALHAGYRIYETPTAAVVHRGFYKLEQRGFLVQGYWYGTGAAFAKHLQRRQWSVLMTLARLAWNWALRRSRIAASLGKYPKRLSLLRAFIRGLAAGIVTPVSGATGHYMLRERREAAYFCKKLPF